MRQSLAQRLHFNPWLQFDGYFKGALLQNWTLKQDFPLTPFSSGQALNLGDAE